MEIRDHISSLLIWDDKGPPPPAQCTILWQSFNENKAGSIVSIPKFVEENALELRGKYLKWIYELGEKRYKENRVVDYLELRPNLSFWWMTLLLEKCNFAKSPQIDDAIRLLALEKWLSRRKISHLTVISSNSSLVAVIEKWCCSNGVKFKTKKSKLSTFRLSSRRHIFFRRLPFMLRGYLWLIRKTWLSWPLRGVGVDEWHASSAKNTFISYLFNLVPQAASAGNFESRYWAHLPEQLEQSNIKTRWLHLWVRDGNLSNGKNARLLIQRFNANESINQVHVTLESFINSKTLMATFRDWSKTRRKCKLIEKTLASVTDEATFDLWPIVREDWKESIYGSEAAAKHLMLNCFEAAFIASSVQTLGVYLQENIGWEFGLIAAWRQQGHGRLVGVPHTVVRFWDLRYHFDSRIYKKEDKFGLPYPDSIAVNGPIAKSILIEGGCPRTKIIEVEALRYLHLLSIDRFSSDTAKIGKIRILVIGDYVKQNTINQMKILESYLISIKRSDIEIIVKSHPAQPISARDYPGINFVMVEDSLNHLLYHCNIAYASSATSGAVDAYLSGIPVISVLSENTLNLSPLRGLPNAIFISKKEELGCAIDKIMTGKNSLIRGKINYFYLDENLPQWIKLLQHD